MNDLFLYSLLPFFGLLSSGFVGRLFSGCGGALPIGTEAIARTTGVEGTDQLRFVGVVATRSTDWLGSES